MTTEHTMAEAIFQAHRSRFADRPPVADTTPGSGEHPVYQAARHACLRLGFIPADADALARAWQAQTTRLGHIDAAAWPAEPVDFGLRPWPRSDAFAPCPRRLGLYAVLPDAAWVARMAQAGVPTLQLRYKSNDAGAIRREVQAAIAAVEGTDSLLFINDHWQAAIDAGASTGAGPYGVHLGQEDLDALRPADLAAIRTAGLRLGVSTHGYAEMQRADAVGPSYIAIGAVFPTTLKAMATAPQGMARLEAYARLLRDHALVAIGGIDAARFGEVLKTGVGSVAVVRALIAAPDPEAAARELQARMQAG